ncbi:uncharacterized protein L201_004108 [Kwoniella dendrophila CBS 6074]|uniref:RING-type E3 ubiquitin transferase n=1 Tax=Kwoniella dendrophila CBS 6074 TaxID=1295534 RepID=A0AAX4JXC8_9TREE
MPENTELSDADKIRLKRLARLGTSTPTQQEFSKDTQDPSTSSTPIAHTPVSAGSRLLSTPQPNIPSTANASSSSNSKPAPAASATTTPAKAAAKPSLSVGKRPASSTPSTEPVGPRVVASKPSNTLAKVDYGSWQSKKVGEIFSVTLSKQIAEEKNWNLCWLKGLQEELTEENNPQPLQTTIELADRLLIARLSLDTAAMATSEKDAWSTSFNKLKALIISYCGMTLEDPTMFPQPQDKPVGPAEFLPLLLSVTVPSSSNGDQYSSASQPPVLVQNGALSNADLLPFLNDLAIGFPSDTMADVITPTLSLFFQEWYKITPTPDILGPDWRRYLGALPSLPVWVAPEVTAPKLEWQSLLGPLTRLSVFPREFPEIWKTYFSNPTERKKEDIEANKSNLRYTLGGLHTSLFNIYNAIVRASPESREGVLDFFALTLKLNEKRAGMRVSQEAAKSGLQFRLFEPVMDAQFSKIDKVDISYYKISKRVDITEETKIKGTKEEADEYFGNAMEEKNMSEIEKDLKRTEAQRGSWAGGEAAIKKLKSTLLTIILRPPYQYFDFLARYHPDALDDVDKDILITFVITFLSPNYVNNPFLKAKLVSILSYGLWPMGYWRKGALFDRLSVHSLSTEFLMPTLIRFFIGHTQFWDKFNFRRDIQRIFKSLWENPLHREAFVKARHDDFDQFIRFVNMLMSDTTFHLEESLTGMAKISSIQNQMANTEAWSALPQNEQQDQESQMRQAESSAPFHTQMGLENVKLIRDITATTKEPFVTAEIVDRLAASLDENLAVLVGPKMSELKVTNPEKYSFKPKDLLAAIAQIYLNLGNEADFIRAVANDGRSYSKELFEKFARLLKNRAIMTDAEVAEVISFTQKVEDMKATILMEDEREVPDEFLDPLLSTLMKDPVILPVSRVVIDRGTIRTVLLSKEVDPFNNVPLKYEECIPDTELKAKIDAWLAEGNTQKAPEVMDVDHL